MKPTQLESSLPTLSTTTSNEYDTIWTSDKTFEKRPLISGEGRFAYMDLAENGLDLSFKVKASEPLFLVIYRIYFPGWRLKVDNIQKEIISNYKTDNYNYSGLIAFNLPSGSHDVSIAFGETKLRFLSDILTILGLIFIIISIILSSIIHWHKMNRCKSLTYH